MPLSESRIAELKHREWVNQKRAELGPTEVRLHHIPQWFSVAVRQAMKEGAEIALNPPLKYKSYDSFWDHWGSTVRVDGRPSFCSEPYQISDNEKRLCELLAAQVGCDLEFSCNSWWYPTRTERVEFIRTAKTLTRRNPKVPCVLMGGPLDGKVVHVGRQQLWIDNPYIRGGMYALKAAEPHYVSANIESELAVAHWATEISSEKLRLSEDT